MRKQCAPVPQLARGTAPVLRYSLFRPELYWWRLVLTLRKFCEVTVALMFSTSPLFQAWCVLHILPNGQCWVLLSVASSSWVALSARLCRLGDESCV